MINILLSFNLIFKLLLSRPIKKLMRKMLLKHKFFFVLELPLLLLKLFLTIKFGQIFFFVFYYLLRLLFLNFSGTVEFCLFEAIFDIFQLLLMIIHLNLPLGFELLFLLVISILNIDFVIFLNMLMIN